MLGAGLLMCNTGKLDGKNKLANYDLHPLIKSCFRNLHSTSHHLFQQRKGDKWVVLTIVLSFLCVADLNATVGSSLLK